MQCHGHHSRSPLARRSAPRRMSRPVPSRPAHAIAKRPPKSHATPPSLAPPHFFFPLLSKLRSNDHSDAQVFGRAFGWLCCGLCALLPAGPTSSEPVLIGDAVRERGGDCTGCSCGCDGERSACSIVSQLRAYGARSHGPQSRSLRTSSGARR
jgi:hypothetical protein